MSENIENNQGSKDELKEAIIFVPGLMLFQTEQSFEQFVLHITRFLDINSNTASATFEIQNAGRQQDISLYDAKHSTRISTIRRSQSVDGKSYAIDVYEMAYMPILLEPQRSLTPLRRFIRAVIALGWSSLLLISRITFLRKQFKSKGTLSKLQIIFMLTFFTLFVVYVVVLAFTLIASALELPSLGQQLNSPTKLNINMFYIYILQFIVLVIAAIDVIFPKLRAGLSKVFDIYPDIISFLDMKNIEGEIAEKFQNLIDYVASQNYEGIHIVGFSMGSIIALNNIFPPTGEPETCFQNIDTLVTLGCPYDIIRLFVPNYFNNRHFITHVSQKRYAPLQWINVYNPIDVMGSNFRNDEKIGEAEQGIKCGNQVVKPDENQVWREQASISLIKALYLSGFQAHVDYWDKDAVGRSAYSQIVRTIYKDKPILS